MSKTVKVLVSVLAAIGLLAGCTAAPAATPTQAPADTEKAALEEQVEVLTDKIDELQKENEALQSDSGASVAVDDLAYLLNTISASGQALTSFPALVSAMAASGEGYMLTISRLEDETGGNNAGAAPEDVYADVFTYAYYDGYLMPELDEGFGDYIKDGDGVQFIVYMLGDQVIFLNEILVP
jgi:ABC-type glycerol-3-phosphate transport system substrate-binding protein